LGLTFSAGERFLYSSFPSLTETRVSVSSNTPPPSVPAYIILPSRGFASRKATVLVVRP